MDSPNRTISPNGGTADTLPRDLPSTGILRENFGEVLERTRLNAGLTLTDVSERTKLSCGLIRRLESGDLEQIGVAPHYCETYLRQLAMAYDLTQQQTADLLELFEQSKKEFQVKYQFRMEQDDAPSYLKDTRNKRGRLPALLLSAITVTILVLAILGVLLNRYQQKKHIHDSSPDYDLPSLLEPQRLPMDVMQIPNS